MTHGDFVDYIQIRGDIRPAKSIVLAAPLQSGGDLQIVKLVKNGAAVKKGDVLVEFDATTLQQRLLERQSDLKPARRRDRAARRPRQKINAEQQQTALMKAKYDVERAKLDLGKRDLVSRIEYEEAKLSLADAEQRQKEIEAKERLRSKAGADADLRRQEPEARQGAVRRRSHQRRRSRRCACARRPTARSTFSRTRAPAACSAATASSSAKAIARGPGASILELPDLSSIHLEARLDESDRGRLKVGQPALVKIEAVPGKDFAARVDLISVLARVDFSSGWPPVRNFDLGLVLDDPRSAHPSRHDGDRAHRRRPAAEHRRSCRPRRSSRRTAVRSSTG